MADWAQPMLPAPGAMLRRKCACPTGGDKDESKVLREAEGATAGGGRSAPPIVHEALRERGQPLEASTRRRFEPLFGKDLGGVHVHTGALADASARAVQARAYTVGADIVFRSGALSPGTSAGAHTLAHELAHVVQGGNAERGAARSLSIGDEGDHAEIEADRLAAQVLAARPADEVRDPSTSQLGGSTLRREPDPSTAEPAPASEGGKTLAPPPGHGERMSTIAAMREELGLDRSRNAELRDELAALPPQTSEEINAERDRLQAELQSAKEQMADHLRTELDTIDEALSALREALPTSSDSNIEVPEQLWADLQSLENDKKAAEAELRTLFRPEPDPMAPEAPTKGYKAGRLRVAPDWYYIAYLDTGIAHLQYSPGKDNSNDIGSSGWARNNPGNIDDDPKTDVGRVPRDEGAYPRAQGDTKRAGVFPTAEKGSEAIIEFLKRTSKGGNVREALKHFKGLEKNRQDVKMILQAQNPTWSEKQVSDAAMAMSEERARNLVATNYVDEVTANLTKRVGAERAQAILDGRASALDKSGPDAEVIREAMEEKEGGRKVGLVYDCATGLPATPPTVAGRIRQGGIDNLYKNRADVEKQLSESLECKKN